MDSPALPLLRILQLADSALPIGSLSHSFGLETLIFDRDIADSREECAASLSHYLEDCLAESVLMDAVLCREAHARSLQSFPTDDLNRQASAFRMARESRDASMSMGRRLAALAAALDPSAALAALARVRELHHSVAFGYILGILGADADATVSAFLHQFLLNMVSAAQRLAPLGQVQASQIVWDLKWAILETVKRSAQFSAETVCAFNHVPEVACMRHACLPTRLFIS